MFVHDLVGLPVHLLHVKSDKAKHFVARDQAGAPVIPTESGDHHSTIPQYKKHEDAVVQARMSAVLLFALQSHHILHQQTPSTKNLLRATTSSQASLAVSQQFLYQWRILSC